MKWDKEVELLEERFNHRGLQFTSPFEGLSLMQAYGYIDKKRFYFHLHHNNASLCVGVYDYATEMKKNMRRTTGLLAPRIPQETDPRLYPSIVLLASRTESGQQRLIDVFAILVENLKPVKEPLKLVGKKPGKILT